jgi:hypothetical protein
MQDDQKQAIMACENGLNFCSKKGKSNSQWKLHFLLFKAECQLKENPAAALETLTAIHSNPVKGSKVETALIALGCATVSLHIGNLEQADNFLTSCANAIEEAGNCENDIISVKQLSGFYFLTYAIIAQSVGRMTQLQEGNEYPLFVRLQESLHDEVANQDLWLSSPAASALGHLLHCSLLRSHGKGSAAAIHLGQAEEIIDQELVHSKICWTKPENELSMPTLFESKIYFQLKAVALEQQALSAIISVDLSGAAGHCLDLLKSLQRFPSILNSRVPSVCIVFGHYLFAVNEFGLAGNLFGTVLDVPNARHLHHLAALALCLSIIQTGDDSKAKHTLQNLQHLHLSEPLELHGLRSHERYDHIKIIGFCFY